MNPWLGIALVLLLLSGLFFILRIYQKYRQPHPETVRKLMHVAMGLVTTSFPWMFEAWWPVGVLAASSISALLVVRSGWLAHQGLATVLHGVDRSSWGELLFPLATAILFLLSQGEPLLFVVPILILTLADAVAALIGVRYGQIHYTTLDGHKSLEGSLSFFLVTFLCVHIALLLFTSTGRLESLLIGLTMGMLVMLFEAIAWRGLDNLFIPLASFVLLKTYLPMEAFLLLPRVLVIGFLGLFVLAWRRLGTLDDSAMIGAVLIGYISWAIGGWGWLLLPTIMFVVSILLVARCSQSAHNIHNLQALFGLAAPSLLWLFLANVLAQKAMLYPYALAYGAQLAMLGISRDHIGKVTMPPVTLVLRTTLQGWGFIFLPFWWLHGFPIQQLLPIFLAGFGILFAAYAFLRLQPGLTDCASDRPRWLRQAGIAMMVSGLGWLAYLPGDNFLQLW